MLDTLQYAVIDSDKKGNDKSKNNQYYFDKLKMYFGEDYNYKGIILSMPTIGDILSIGEDRFYKSLSPFLYNSTSIRVFLWDKFNMDWNKVKDIEVFGIMNQILKDEDKEPANIIFKNMSFNDFVIKEAKRHTEDEEYEIVLYSPSQQIILYEEDYMHIAEYIREMLNCHPKVEKAKGRTAKSWIIQEDKMNMLNKDEDKHSNLLSLISACVNHPGFKYKLQELREVGLYQFMDSVKRLQIYESSRALLNGLYCGFSDLSKINKNEFNFMRDI